MGFECRLSTPEANSTLKCPPARSGEALSLKGQGKYLTNIHSPSPCPCTTSCHLAQLFMTASIVSDSVMCCYCAHFTDDKTKLQSS